MTRIYIGIALVLAYGSACTWAGWEWRDRGADIAQMRSELSGISGELESTRAVLATERAEARRMAGIAEQYERDKQDAQIAADRVAADLRVGNVRLRHEIAALATRSVSATAAASAESDAAAERGAALVGAAIAVGRECDAVQRGLIEAYGVQ